MGFNKSLALKNASKYVRQNKYKAAIQEYREILKAEPHDTTTLNLLGDLYVRTNAIPEAVQTFITVADLYCQSGRTTKAIAILKKASKLDPHHLDCAVKLARLYAQDDLIVEAQQQCLVVAECYLRAGLREQGFSVYRELVQHNPENVEFRLRLAEACLREEMRDRASDTFLEAAQVMQQQGRHEEALKTYLKALAARPESRGALTAAVNIYLQRGETQPAEALIKHLLRVRPDDPEILTLLGHVQQMEVALSEARQAIAQAVEEDSKALAYQVELISACDRAYLTFMTAAAELQRQGKEREALNACLKALKLKPGDKPALFVAVNLYLKLSDTQSAVVMLRHSLRAHPDNVEVLLLLGSVYQQAHDKVAAEQVLARAIAVQPACWRDILDFAGYCVREGDFDRALRQVDRVLEACEEPQCQQEVLDLLHVIVSHDPNCLGALERLVNIYTRGYDTPRQIEALNALASAALFKGEDETAARALRWLIQLEPDEVWHRRLLRKICPHDEAVQNLTVDVPMSADIAPGTVEEYERQEERWEVALHPGDYEFAFSDASAKVEAASWGAEVSHEVEIGRGVDILRAEPIAYEVEVSRAESVAPSSVASVVRQEEAEPVRLRLAAPEPHANDTAADIERGIKVWSVTAPSMAAPIAPADEQAGKIEAEVQAARMPEEAIAAERNEIRVEADDMGAEIPATEHAPREVFVSASTRRRRLLNQRAAQFVPRTYPRRIGGNLPSRRNW